MSSLRQVGDLLYRPFKGSFHAEATAEEIDWFHRGLRQFALYLVAGCESGKAKSRFFRGSILEFATRILALRTPGLTPKQA